MVSDLSGRFVPLVLEERRLKRTNLIIMGTCFYGVENRGEYIGQPQYAHDMSLTGDQQGLMSPQDQLMNGFIQGGIFVDMFTLCGLMH